MLGDAAPGGLVAAAAAGLAVTGVDWVVDDGTGDDCTGPGLADPQPATATSATSAAMVTGKRLFIPQGRRTPPAGCDPTLDFNIG
jgi:hypothetical protein